MGGSADTAGPLELWEADLSTPDKKTPFWGAAKTKKKRRGVGGPQHFQDKIRQSLFGEEVVESQWCFRRNVLCLLLVGRNMLNVSVCLGLLFPGGLI